VSLGRTAEPPARVTLDVGPTALSAHEVKQLWFFLDGAIMDVGTRHHLWRSWGFCSRHAWAYAVVECELRGGRPFATTILYADLVRRAAWRLSPGLLRAHPDVERLRPRAACFTCEFVRGREEAPLPDERHWRAETARVNERRRSRELFRGLERAWRERSCPVCLGGDGLVCRPHLLEGRELADGVAHELAALGRRLSALVGSMTTRQTPVGPLERAAWVEAVGFFSGWSYPAAAVGAPGDGPAGTMRP
jgi:hypothetical protein